MNVKDVLNAWKQLPKEDRDRAVQVINDAHKNDKEKDTEELETFINKLKVVYKLSPEYFKGISVEYGFRETEYKYQTTPIPDLLEFVYENDYVSSAINAYTSEVGSWGMESEYITDIFDNYITFVNDSTDVEQIKTLKKMGLWKYIERPFKI